MENAFKWLQIWFSMFFIFTVFIFQHRFGLQSNVQWIVKWKWMRPICDTFFFLRLVNEIVKKCFVEFWNEMNFSKEKKKYFLFHIETHNRHCAALKNIRNWVLFNRKWHKNVWLPNNKFKWMALQPQTQNKREREKEREFDLDIVLHCGPFSTFKIDTHTQYTQC